MAKTTPASTGSKDMIEGIPSPLAYLGEVILNFENILADAVVPAVVEELDRVRTALIDKEPGYADIAEDVTIAWNPKDFTFNYRVKGASAYKAQELEYGPPAKSLLRHEVLESTKTLGKKITTNLDKELGYGKAGL